MNNWYLFGIFCFLQVFISFEKEIKVSPGEIKFLCTIFPEILKDKCVEYNENKFENKIEIKVHSEIEISTTSKSIQCDICKKFIEKVLNDIGKDRSENTIRKALEKACDNLPPNLRQPCKFILFKFENILVDMIMKNIPIDQICHGIELCSSNDINHSQRIKSIQCQICKRIVEEIFRRIGNKRTEDEIRKAMQGICNIFPVPVQNDCRNLMNVIADSIVKLIKKNVGPEMICSVLQMCFKDTIQTDNGSGYGGKITGETDEFSDEKITAESEIKSIQCQICKRIVAEIFRRIGNKRSEDEIRKAMQGICNIFPVPVQNDCRNLMNAIADSIVKLIKNNVAPEMICSVLQMCFKDTIQTDNEIKWIQCRICKKIVEGIFKKIGNKRTETEIRKSLQNICYLFPVSFRDNCRKLMNAIVDSIVKLIKNNAAPDIICRLLQMCFNVKIQTDDESKSIECDICKKVIQEVLNEIGNDHSKGVIRNALEKVCDTLPVLWRSGCKSFVDKYADELVDMIIKNFSVDQICKQIGLCSSNYLVHHSRKSKSIECDICKKVIQEVLNEIGNDHSKGVIRNALEKVCDTLPVLWRSGCKSFVDKYADELVDMIIKNFSVDQICKQIGLCSSNYLVHHSRNFQSNDLSYIL